MFANFRPISTICQHLYTFGGEVCFTRKWVGCGEGVCESYKYLHLTGLWLGMMDRNNATDRNVYSISHSSSPFFFIPNIYRPEKPTHRNKSYNDDYKITPNDLFHFRHPFVKNSL